MIRRRYGDATYQGTSLSDVADLIAEDGDFDFTSLDSRKLEQLYAAGGWHRALRARLPGIERLRELIKTGELPYVAHVGWGIGGLMVLDTGQVVRTTRKEELLDMVMDASKRDGKKFRLSRLPVRHQRRIKREVSSRRSGLLTWAWGQAATSILQNRPHAFQDDRAQEMITCGFLIPLRGRPEQFHPYLHSVGLGTAVYERRTDNNESLLDNAEKVAHLCELMESQGLGELAVILHLEGDVMTLHRMNPHNFTVACGSSGVGTAMVLVKDASVRTGRSPSLRRLREAYEDEVDP